MKAKDLVKGSTIYVGGGAWPVESIIIENEKVTIQTTQHVGGFRYPLNWSYAPDADVFASK